MKPSTARVLSFERTRQIEAEFRRKHPSDVPRDTEDWRILSGLEHESLAANLQKYLERPKFKVPDDVVMVEEDADHLHRIM